MEYYNLKSLVSFRPVVNDVYFVMLLERLSLEAKLRMYFGYDVIHFNRRLSFYIFVPCA